MLSETEIDKAYNAYAECALWSSYDFESEDNLEGHDLAPETISMMRADVENFVEYAGDLLDELDPEQVGHDFWLTRNHHGAGFWDRGLGELGDLLTAKAHSYGESDLYRGDDGLIYVS